MAMLYWTKLNPTVNELPVNKLFYNKFLYKIKIYCPGARVLESNSLEDLNRNFFRRSEKGDILYNYAGSWSNRRNQELRDHGSVDQLQHYFNTKLTLGKEIKYRIEEPYLSIYSNEEQLLYTIASQVCPARCIEIHKPISSKAQEIILRGEIVSKTINNYNYKIVLKSNYFDDIHIKHSLSDYFYNLKDDIKITKTVMSNLSTSRRRFPGGYFYSKTKDITVFIDLISPGLVTSIFKVTNLYS